MELNIEKVREDYDGFIKAKNDLYESATAWIKAEMKKRGLTEMGGLLKWADSDISIEDGKTDGYGNAIGYVADNISLMEFSEDGYHISSAKLNRIAIEEDCGQETLSFYGEDVDTQEEYDCNAEVEDLFIICEALTALFSLYDKGLIKEFKD